ncbi:zonular occludens toxin domain-containing protein [Thiobacillus denitrificans]|uniref:zonular occludens toxin domain-containing protein n=1 Tax=Thiobacillus denitrificans TaxID=36861 RepID=UPI000360027D|nr:zonular occludens toxin domain-containing protein [Thiobacillus denitrificans]
MITLITGIPGRGKTALLVSMLMEYEKKAERPLFVMGVPSLKIEHIVAPPVTEWTEMRPSPEDSTLELAYFTFPPNSILIVDECQRVYRPRASASKVPPYVAALETHRHTGLDIILLTQKPKLIDTNVRELVGRHIHIRDGLLGRYLYEWPHIADGESRLDRADAAKRKFSPPKEAFSKYKSAEAHTKNKFRVNQLFIYAGLALALLAYQSTKVFGIFDKYTSPDKTHAAVQEGDLPPRSGAEARAPSPARLSELTLARKMPLIEALTPSDPHNPLSAPLYASATPPVVVPEIQGCIANTKKCTCFTQQQTPLWIPDEQCRQRAAGLYFDPYRQPVFESRSEPKLNDAQGAPAAREGAGVSLPSPA